MSASDTTPEVYQLPMALTTALVTNRIEFVEIWVKEKPEEREEVGRLLKDMLQDRQNLAAMLHRLKDQASNVRGMVDSFERECEFALAAAQGGEV